MKTITSLLALILITLSCSPNAIEKTHMKQKTKTHPLDKSKQKTLSLENGLKVYLLSDPNFNKASASMTVEVGSLENPEDRDGLAHFLEHMLFLGTEKYPDSDEYGTYLKSNGGYANAYTAGDHTNYQFEIMPNKFEGAIDRFSQFFIAPLFTEEYTEREVNAVNSEHEKNIMNDMWRMFQVSSLFLKEGHPERKFSTGNLETLGDISRDELIAFYEKYYSSNRMTLALCSTHSLEKMEKWTREYFSPIKNKHTEQPSYSPDLYEKKETFRLVSIDPIKDLQDLYINFALPATRQYYESKPGRILGFILGHEGKGSLLSYLKSRGWAISLSAGAGSSTVDYGWANIHIELTPKGVKEYKKVIETSYSFIKLMREKGYQSFVFNELKTMAALDEIYSDKGEGAWRAVSLANELSRYPMEDAGRSNYIYRKESVEAYQKILSLLTPDNMACVLMAKGVKTDKTEHFYQANYAYTEDKDFYIKLLNTEILDDFQLPGPNHFIPKKASIPKRELKEDVLPELVLEDKGIRLYFGQDHEFLRPKGVINYKIRFPENKMNLDHRVKMSFYVDCVGESLNELAYPAQGAGLRYRIDDGYEGLYLSVGGYSESALVLYKEVVNHMVNFQINEEQFEGLKNNIVRDYQNFPLSDAWRIGRERNSEIMQNIRYSQSDMLKKAETISLSDIKSFSKTLYKNTYLEGFVYGDMTKEMAIESAKYLLLKTETEAIEREKTFEVDFLTQSEPESVQQVETLEVNNSCFNRQYFLGMDSPKMRAVGDLITLSTQQAFYNEMRTNQQLGYIVWSYDTNYEKTLVLIYTIQSGAFDAAEVEKRADKLLATFPKLISELPDESFEAMKQAAIEKLEEKAKSISKAASKYKTIVFEHEADFNRDKNTIAALKEIKKEEVVDILSKTLDHKTRRMVTNLLFAKQHENKDNIQSSFDTLSQWKKSRLYK
jgi:insulysin